MISSKQSSPAYINCLRKVLVGFCCVGTASLVSVLIKYSAYGFDFSDEGFYLVWIADPFLYDVSITQFGFVYHPLHILLGGDIVSLRRANILITFGLAWVLVFLFLGSLEEGVGKDKLVSTATSAALATSALTLFTVWLPSPSYNSLNLQALLVANSGLILSKRTLNFASVFGWVLVGVGGWLTFMAKPSSSLAFAIVAALYLSLAGKFSIRMLLCSVGCSSLLVLVSALLIDNSLSIFLTRLQLGIEFSTLLEGGHTLSQALRIDELRLNTQSKLSFIFFSGCLALLLFCMTSKNLKGIIVGSLISTVLFLSVILITRFEVNLPASAGQIQGIAIFSVVFAVMISAWSSVGPKIFYSISASKWAMAILFLLMPHVYAFGTNASYWQSGSSAVIFWLLGGLAIFSEILRVRASWLFLLPIGLATLVITSILLRMSIEQPYRQSEPLRLNASSLEVGAYRSVLILSQSYADYISRAMTVSRTAGFEPGTPIIDLSGQSPGMLYALGGKSIGQAWTLGGYPGSLRLALAAFNRVDCADLVSAWLLVEPKGPTSISSSLLFEQGLSFPAGYMVVGQWFSPEGAGGNSNRRKQFLYAPISSQKNFIACSLKRVGLFGKR